MKIIRTPHPLPVEQAPHPAGAESQQHTWKLLVVDDEPDVRTLTRISLRDFSFANRSLEFIEAGSSAEAIEKLEQHADIAVALIDVVMETADAGLNLVEHIRTRMGNRLIRIIIRTGQPGAAPERFVIDHYDIDDYKDKTELTATRLYTTLRSAIKAYRDLQTIDANRQGLEQVLRATPSIYQLGYTPLSNFFDGMLTQIIGLCRLSQTSHIGTFDGIIGTVEEDEVKIRACTEHFIDNPRLSEIQQHCAEIIFNGAVNGELTELAELFPLTIGKQPVGYIYIEPIEALSSVDRNLIHIFAAQCSQALENHQLHNNILSSFESAIDMLAEIAEYKDKATGGHVNRLDFYTRATAKALGVSEDEAKAYGKASRLHDVGKVGIPDYILAKPDKLTAEEFEIIKKHTTLGANILGHDPAFDLAKQIALSHHERWDGSGYPEGILASSLPLPVRIVSVVDAFDAMISWRPYKHPWPVEKAREVIFAASGTQFDPEVVTAFISVLNDGGFDDLIAQATKPD